VESLKRQYGWDMKGPDLLSALVADCPKQRSFMAAGALPLSTALSPTPGQLAAQQPI
jgi:hypothetical protein